MDFKNLYHWVVEFFSACFSAFFQFLYNEYVLHCNLKKMYFVFLNTLELWKTQK